MRHGNQVKIVQIGVDCKATRSIPSLVKNLNEEAPDISFDNLVCVVGEEFLKEDKEKVKLYTLIYL